MTKTCVSCGLCFKDDDQIVAIIESRFKAIPSRVMYAIASPTIQDIHEILHRECAIHEMLIPPDDMGIID